jgi:hypothetical protein
MKQIDRATLEMALVGYEAERQKIEAAMATIRTQVDGHAAAPAVDGARGPKRAISVAAKRRIAAAQRKRWAAFHAGQRGGTAKNRTTEAVGRGATRDTATNRGRRLLSLGRDTGKGAD